jgi:uncharacterized protein YbjQ (UPF0145 family)
MEFAVYMGAKAVLGLYASRRQAEAMEAAADFAAVQAQLSLEQAQFVAKLQLKAGREEAIRRRQDSARAVGAAVVGVAGSGTEVSGSPLAVIADAIHRDESDAAAVITNAKLRAFSEEARGRAQALGFTAQAEQLREGADITRTVGLLDAIATGAAAAGGYYKLTGGASPALPTGTGYGDYGAGGMEG